jgi:hypothetical protein
MLSKHVSKVRFYNHFLLIVVLQLLSVDRFTAYNGKQSGNPAVAVELLIDLAHGTGPVEGKPFPTSINLGSDSHSEAKKHSEAALVRLEEWKAISYSTDFEK